MDDTLLLNHWHWLILGAALALLEVLSFTTILLWAGVAAFLTAALAFLAPELEWQLQITCFAVTTALLLLLTRKLLHRQRERAPHATLNRRADNLIGQVHRLNTAIADGRGTININDTLWQLSGPDVPSGTQIEIVAVDTNVLQVVVSGDQ